MGGHYLRRRVKAADWAFRLAAFAGALLVTGFFFFRMDLSSRGDFATVIALSGGLLGLGLILSLYALLRVWSRGSYGGGRALAALFLGLVVAVPFVIGAFMAMAYPSGNSARTANMVASDAADTQIGGSVLLGREFPATARDVYGASRQVADDLGWEVEIVQSTALPLPAEGDLGVEGTVAVPRPTLRSSFDVNDAYDRFAVTDAGDYTLTAVARAPLFGFPSDVEIRIQEDEGSTFVDLRSHSRDLPRDLGQNRRFVESFLTRLDAAMEQAQSGTVDE